MQHPIFKSQHFCNLRFWHKEKGQFLFSHISVFFLQLLSFSPYGSRVVECCFCFSLLTRFWFRALSSVIFQALTSLFIPFGFLPPLLFSLRCSPPACSFLLIWVGALSSLISFGFPPLLSSLANVTRIKSFLFATHFLNLV